MDTNGTRIPKPSRDRAILTKRLRSHELEVTIDDPKAYTKPWKATIKQHLCRHRTARVRL
jgi:hypothetical protein